MQGILGPQRWQMVEALLAPTGMTTLRGMLGLDAGLQSREFAFWISENQGGPGIKFMGVNYRLTSAGACESSSGMDLKAFAPGADGTTGLITSENDLKIGALQYLPDSVSSKIFQWLQQEAANRVGKESSK